MADFDVDEQLSAVCNMVLRSMHPLFRIGVVGYIKETIEPKFGKAVRFDEDNKVYEKDYYANKRRVGRADDELEKE